MVYFICGLLTLATLLAGDLSGLGAGIRLNLKVLDDKLAIMLVNDSNVDQLVDKRLAIESLLGEITLLISDGEATYPLTAMVRAAPPDATSYVILHPSEFVGRYITFRTIAGQYSLQHKCYEVTAIYEYKWDMNDDAFTGPIKSNSVCVCIDGEDQKPGKGTEVIKFGITTSDPEVSPRIQPQVQ